jgi:serine/threonine-protein kinase
MSPEQARGLKVDARSDIFSLGIVLYEMIAGRRPFVGATASDVLAAILQAEPTPLAQVVPSVPAELDRILMQALRKDCAARYQVIKDLQLDLKRLKQELEFAARQQQPTSVLGGRTLHGGERPMLSEPSKTSGSGPARVDQSASLARKRRSRRAIDSLAILPLVSASMDSQAEYLSDGITENVINRLSPLSKLKVMARSTVFRYKGGETDPQAVGRELGVRAVLTGRVLQLGDRVVIKTELVDVTDGTQIWGGQFNRELTDLFALEEDISREISEQLQLKVGGQGKRSLKKSETRNSKAYELYLKGNYYFHKASPDAMKKAIEYFQQAIAADPDYAQAHAGLAKAYLFASYTVLSHREALPQAEQAAATALRLNEGMVEAHTALGQVKMFKDWDWAGAEAEFKRALELNPKDVDALDLYGRYLTWRRRFDQAIATFTRALELDPLSLALNTYLGMALLTAGEYDQAIKQCQKALELDPHCSPALGFLGVAYEQKGDYAVAIATFQKQRQINDIPLVLSNLGYAYAVSGSHLEAQQMLDELQARLRQRPVPSEYIALIHIGLGQTEQAFAWLERSCDEHSVLLPGWLNSDPRFDVLRADPRFAQLLRRVGLAT